MSSSDPAAQDSEFEARLAAELDRRIAVTPAMMHSIDASGKLVSVSDTWLEKLGYTREEVLGRRSSEFLTEESRAYAVRDVLPEFFKTGRCDNVEYQMVCKDGSVIDVLLSAYLDRSVAAGGVSLAVITDVTALKETKRKLLASETRYRGLVEDQTELVSLATSSGELLYANHAYAAFYGQTPEAMVGRNLFDFVPGEGHAALAEHFRQVCAADHSMENMNELLTPDGRSRWFAWTNRALRDDDGAFTAIHSVGRDIEERVQAVQLLKESETRYRLLADNSTDMVFQLGRNLVRQYVSPACCEILGYEPDYLVGITPIETAHPEDAGRLSLVFQTLLNGTAERQSIINRVRHRDGRWVWVEAKMRAVRDADGGPVTGIIGSLRDISARKAVEDELAKANQRLQALAGQDSLTDLANRRTFDEALAREYLRATREKTTLALIMIDVDHFKAFNDIYGHTAGDDCLRHVSHAISGAIRPPADMAARYGGEEFVVLLPNTDEATASLIAEHIGQAILDLQITHQASACAVVTISAGVASLAGGDAAPEVLVNSADRALYRAKSFGRNAVIRASEVSDVPEIESRRVALR